MTAKPMAAKAVKLHGVLRRAIREISELRDMIVDSDSLLDPATGRPIPNTMEPDTKREVRRLEKLLADMKAVTPAPQRRRKS